MSSHMKRSFPICTVIRCFRVNEVAGLWTTITKQKDKRKKGKKEFRSKSNAVQTKGIKMLLSQIILSRTVPKLAHLAYAQQAQLYEFHIILSRQEIPTFQTNFKFNIRKLHLFPTVFEYVLYSTHVAYHNAYNLLLFIKKSKIGPS